MPNAELARRILDAIETSPDHFDMTYWYFNYDPDAVFLPEESPLCGTTMCIAGWAAHLTGWILLPPGRAVKGDVRAFISEVAMEALDVDITAPFHLSKPAALVWLRKVAAS